MAETKQQLAYKYVGNGEHYHGIPARGLLQEEFEALDADQRRAVEGSPHLYEATERPKAAEPKDEGPVAAAVGPSAAQALAAAGFDTPAKIKKASDEELRAVEGVGDATLEKLRALK